MIEIGNPAGGLAFLAVAVLLLLLRLRRSSRRMVVPSLLLWRQLPARDLDRERARPDLLWWLQLAIVAVLATGSLQPALLSSTARHAGSPLVLVVDCSASMGVREGRTRRLGLAIAQARARLEALAPGVPAMLIAVAAQPRLVHAWTSDRATLYRALEKLRVMDTRGALALAVERALAEARGVRGARVLVVSDDAPAPGLVAPSAQTAVDWIAIGTPRDNVALTDLFVEQLPFAGPAEATVTVMARNFASTSRTLRLTASAGGMSWTERWLSLEAGAAEPVVVTRPPASGVFVIALENTEDALPADDRLVGWLAPAAALDLVAVTDSDASAAALRMLAAALPAARIEIVTAAGWREHGPPGPQQITLFDRFMPDASPSGGPALYIAPPPGNRVCPTRNEHRKAIVIDWDDTHPLLDGLESLEALEVDSLLPLEAPAWASVLVYATAARAALPLLVAGEDAQRRIACLASELPAPLATSDTVPFVVLLLNTLRWLGEHTPDAPLVVRTGEPRRVPGRIDDADRALRYGPGVLAADRVGIHRISMRDGAERLVLANLLDESESDTRRGRSGLWEASAESERPRDRGVPWALARWFWGVALVLLGIEWAVGIRRR